MRMRRVGTVRDGRPPQRRGGVPPGAGHLRAGRPAGTARGAALALLGGVLASSGLAVVAAPAALARPDARTMTCAALNAFIAENGAVVMTTGPHTYQRFVAAPGFCDPWQVTAPVYQPTRDRKKCVVRSVCIDPAFDIPFESTFD